MKIALLYLIGLSLLSYLFIRTDWSHLLSHMQALSITTFALLLMLQLVTVCLIGLQWFCLAKHIGINLPYGFILNMNFAGTFFESITPAVKSGGEAYKAVFLKKHGFNAAKTTSLIGTQKVFSLFGFLLVMMISLGIFTMTQTTPPQILGPYMNGVWLFIIGFVSILTLIAVVLKRQFTRDNRVTRFINNLKIQLSPLKTQKSRWVIHIALSLLIWSLYAFKVLVVAHAIGVYIPVVVAALTVYLAYMVAMLPLTPGGIGTFEGTFAAVLSLLGFTMSAGLFMAIILRLATFWFALLISTIGLLGFNAYTKKARWWHVEQHI